jgi:predicted metalloprotease with PDZ domain
MKGVLLFCALLCSFTFGGNNSASAMLPADDIVIVGEDDDDGGWLGVSIRDMTRDLAKAMGSETDEGALIDDVEEDSPADSAGLRKEDIVVQFADRIIRDADDLIRAVSRSSPGTTADVTVMRDNAKRTYRIALGKASSRERFPMVIPEPPPVPRMEISFSEATSGMSLQTLNRQLAEYFGVPDNEGVLVTEVEKESTAEKAGVRAGDVITRVEKQRIRDVDDIRREMREHKEGETVSLEVLRKGSSKKLSLEVTRDARHMYWFAPHGQFDIDDQCRSGHMYRDKLRSLELELRSYRPDLEELHEGLREMELYLRDMARSIKSQITRRFRPVAS